MKLFCRIFGHKYIIKNWISLSGDHNTIHTCTRCGCGGGDISIAIKGQDGKGKGGGKGGNAIVMGTGIAIGGRGGNGHGFGKSEGGEAFVHPIKGKVTINEFVEGKDGSGINEKITQGGAGGMGIPGLTHYEFPDEKKPFVATAKYINTSNHCMTCLGNGQVLYDGLDSSGKSIGQGYIRCFQQCEGTGRVNLKNP